MAFGWSQNIQRRLLLYVLQQISLFSNLDLSNVDVSLGASSIFNFQDIALDVSEIDVPFIDVKSGAIERLHLDLTVSGGLDISGKGITLDVLPKDIAESEIDSVILAKSVPDFLAKSMYDLTTSVIQFSNDQHLNIPIDEVSSASESDISDSEEGTTGIQSTNDDHRYINQPTKPTKLQTMRNKVLSTILGNLTLDLSNILINLVDDKNSCKYSIKVDMIKLETTGDTIRKMTLGNIVVSHESLKDIDNKLDISSSVYNNEVSQSMQLSGTAASSIYMSAHEFQNESRYTPPSPPSEVPNGVDGTPCQNLSDLVSLEDVIISFRGLTSLDDISLHDVSVDISSVEFRMDNFVKYSSYTLHRIFLLIQAYIDSNDDTPQKMPSPEENNISDIRHSEAYMRFQNKQKVQSQDTLSFIHLNKIYFSFMNNISIDFEKTSITRNTNGSYTIEVSLLDIKGNGIVFSKHPSPFVKIDMDADDINIEFQTAHNLTLSGDGMIAILKCFTNLKDFISHLLPSKSAMKRSYKPKNKANSRIFRLHTKDISVSLRMESYKLTILFDPIFYDSKLSQLEIPGIRLIKHDADCASEIISLSGIKLDKFHDNMEVETVNENFTPVLINSQNSCCIDTITVKSSRAFLEELTKELEPIIDTLQQQLILEGYPQHSGHMSSKKSQHMKKSVRILNTSGVHYKKSSHAAVILKCKLLKFKLATIFPGSGFGALKGRIEDVNMFIMQDIQNGFLEAANIVIERSTTQGVKENIVGLIDNENDKQPSLCVSLKKAKFKYHMMVSLRNVNINYHSSWVTLFKRYEEHISTIGHAKAGLRKPKVVRRYDQEGFVVDVKFQDSSLFILPFRLKAGLLILVDQFTSTYGSHLSNTTCVIKTASVLLIDDICNRKILAEKTKSKSLLTYYCLQGFSAVSKLNILKFEFKNTTGFNEMNINCEEVEISLCADSQHTFIQLLIDLKYPETFPDKKKFNSETSELVDIFRNVDMDFLNKPYDIATGTITSRDSCVLKPVESFLDRSDILKINQGDGTETTESSHGEASETNSIAFDDNYIDKLKNMNIKDPIVDDAATTPEVYKIDDFNLKMNLNCHIKRANLKLYDGYDWRYSRRIIKDSLKDLSKKEKADTSDRDELQKGDEEVANQLRNVSVFDSIYLPSEIQKPDPRNTERRNIGANDSLEAQSVEEEHLNLRPSRFYQLLVQLVDMDLSFKGYNVDTPTRETSDESSDILNDIELSVSKVEIIDNVPTSSWNKFLTQLNRDNCDKQSKMLKMRFTMTRPLDYLEAIDYALDITVSPLRLHLDQDAVDFLIRFLEFRDPRFTLIDEYPDIPYIDRFHLSPIQLCLDYKPKAVNYSKLRSGHTSELMNFIVLDGAHATLKEINLHGLNGFGELNGHLKKTWTPDIIQRQLGGIVGGIAPIKSFFTLGSEVKTFVTVLMSDYKSGNEMSTSFRNNGNIFLKTTTGDFIKLGAKMSSGTQAILEATEQRLGGQGIHGRLSQDVNYEKLVSEDQLVGGSNPRVHDHEPSAVVIEESNGEDIPPRVVSLYADQPLDVHAGLEEAYHSLEKHMNIAYDAVWKAHEEWEGEPNQGPRAAAVSAVKAAPIAIIRPLIGVTEAVSKTFQGLSNQIDRGNVADMRDKYKSGHS